MVGCEALRPRTHLEMTMPTLTAAQAVEVQPHEITTSNAKTKLKQLQEELDREMESLSSDPF